MATKPDIITISVIIPYFQREPGILRRALESIVKQRLPDNCAVEVVVVDDGSPVAAQPEADGLAFTAPFHLKIIRQANAGVAAARNCGLAAVDKATTYIAFLDSDDYWLDGHLRQGIEALEAGNDLYFCDNERPGAYQSHFASGTAVIMPFMRTVILNEVKDLLEPEKILRCAQDDNNLPGGDALVSLDRNEMATIILRQFPCQVSTTIFRRSIVGDLRFDTSLKNAGEDVIFFLKLVARMQRICCSPKIMVHCGSGVNLYFANMDWNSAGYLKRIIDNMKAHALIQRTMDLSAENHAWNSRYISDHRRKVVFHCLRYWIKTKGQWPPELKKLIRDDKRFIGWFFICAVQVGVGRLLGLYHAD